MASADRDTEKMAVLARHGVPGVLEVHTTVEGVAEVTFSAEPTEAVTAQVHKLLAPDPVSLIWYEGSYTTDFDPVPDADDDQPETGTACGVCRQHPSPWPHRTETPAGASLASAGHWNLCDRCHTLLLAGDLDALAARLAIEDLPDRDRRDLVSRLR